MAEVAGPRVETLAEMARGLVAARRGDPTRVEERSDPEVLEDGGLLPCPNAFLRGPTFQKWLGSAL